MTALPPDASVEATLDDIRAAAKRVAKLAKELDAAARTLDQAATKGELNRVKTSTERTAAVQRQVEKEVVQLTSTWPMDDSAVDDAVDGRLMMEVNALLDQQGIQLHRYGNGWSASPVLVRVDQKARVVKIDRTRVATLRPSMVAAAIVAARQRSSFRPDQFIETLHTAYRVAVGSNSLGEHPARLGSSVPLSDVYKVLTLHPDSRRDYPIEAFARDLFVLDRSGVSTTKDGQRMFFSASTSSKGGGGVLTVLDETGAPQNYFAIAFRESQS